MTIAHENEYQLRTGDFDCREEILPASVLDIFQDIAGVSAEQTPGMSGHDMKAKGLYWIVTHTRYEIVRAPLLHERVIARTWPLAPTRMGFQREYTIRSLDGETLVKGTSQWLMMDRETRSMVNARDAYDGPSDFSEEKNFAKHERRIRPFEGQGKPRAVTPAFCDIDMNGHVNNTRYATFFLDAWEPARDEHVRAFQIDYRHEIRLGETVQVSVRREDGQVLGEGTGDDGEPRFFCRATLGGGK